jgi:hypothetical protein
MALITSLRAARQAMDELTKSLERLGRIPAVTSRPSLDQDLAAAVRRGQHPELVESLRKALGL